MAVELPSGGGVRHDVGQAPSINPAAYGGMVEGLSSVVGALGKARLNTQATQDKIDEIRHNDAVHEQQEADNVLLSQQSAAFAALRERLRNRDHELQTDPDYTVKIKGETDEALRQFNSSFGRNDRVRQRFADNMGALSATMQANADIRARGFRAQAQGDGFDATVDTAGGTIFQNPTPDEYRMAVGLVGTAADGMEGILPAAKAEAKRKAIAAISASYFGGLFEKGKHEDVAKLIASGQWDWMGADRLKSFTDRVDMGRKHVALVAEQEEKARAAQVTEAFKVMKEKLDIGVVVPDTEIAAIEASLKATGNPADAVEAYGLRVKAGVNRTYGEGRKSPTEIRAAMDGLSEKVRTGKANAYEQVALTQMRTLYGKAGDDDADRLKAEYGKGAAGQINVLNQLRSMDPQRRFEIAEKVDKGLGFVAMIPSAAVRANVVQGAEYRRADKELAPDDKVSAAFRALLGRAGNAYGGDALDDFRETAAALYAFSAQKRGARQFDRAMFAGAMNMALGARYENGQYIGGLGRWKGSPVILPDGKTQGQFETLLSRHDFSMARNSAGQRVDKAYVLGSLTPRYGGETADGKAFYVFEDANGNRLQHAFDGSAYTMAVK